MAKFVFYLGSAIEINNLGPQLLSVAPNFSELGTTLALNFLVLISNAELYSVCSAHQCDHLWLHVTGLWAFDKNQLEPEASLPISADLDDLELTCEQRAKAAKRTDDAFTHELTDRYLEEEYRNSSKEHTHKVGQKKSTCKQSNQCWSCWHTNP